MATAQGPIKLQDSNGNLTGTIQLAESMQFVNPATGLPRLESITTFINLVSTQISSGSTVSNKSNVSDMLSGSYSANDLVYVSDASAWSGLNNATYALFQYLGGGESSTANYRLLFAREYWTAGFIDYDNSDSTLASTKEKSAIDELDAKILDIAVNILLGDTDFSSNITFPPGTNQWELDNADPLLATQIEIHDTVGGADASDFLLSVQDGGWLIFTKDASNIYQFQVSTATDQTGSIRFTITGRLIQGTISDTDVTSLRVDRSGSTTVPDWSTTVAGKVKKGTKTEAEANTSDVLGLSILQGFNQWLNNVANYVHAGLPTTVKTILGAISELFTLVSGKQAKATGATDDNIATFTSEQTVDSGKSFGVQNDAEQATTDKIVDAEDTKLGWLYWIANHANTSLNTIDKTILGALNELEDRNSNIWSEYGWVASAAQTDFVIPGANAGEIVDVAYLYIKKVGDPAIIQFLNDGNFSIETTTVTDDTIRTSEALGAGDIVYMKYWKSGNVIAIPQVVGLSKLNKNMNVASQISGDDVDTGLTILGITHGNVEVMVEGILMRTGDGTKTGVDGYFSGDSGTTARAKESIVLGDKWYWVESESLNRTLNPIGPLLTSYQIDFLF